MDRPSAARPDFYLIVSAYCMHFSSDCFLTNDPLQTDQDTVYEQDLLREAGNIKPWLAYIEFKQQNGTLYEQAFVCPNLRKRDDTLEVFPNILLTRLWSARVVNCLGRTSYGRW